jgi:putative aminopeptidase FrvX
MTNDLKGTLRDLTASLARIPGIAGHEQMVATEYKRLLGGVVEDISVDRFGNVYGRRRGQGRGPTLMLAVHTDEIGFLVRSVEAAGWAARSSTHSWARRYWWTVSTLA